MFILDLLDELLHKGKEVFGLGALLFLLRQIVHLLKEDELRWTREEVERLTNRRYPGGTKRLWRRAARNYEKLSDSLQPAASRGNQLRRKIHMNNVKWITLIPSIAGAIKLVLQAFNITIPDEQWNAVVNGASALATVVGVFMSHRTDTPSTTANKPVMGANEQNHSF